MSEGDGVEPQIRTNVAVDHTLTAKLNGLWELQQKQKFTDLKLVAEGVEINVHAIIAIANSEFIKGVFTYSNNCKEVRVDYADDDKDSLNQIVKYMYGQQPYISQDNIFKVYRIASFLLLNDLVKSLNNIFATVLESDHPPSMQFLSNVLKLALEFEKNELKHTYYSYICIDPEKHTELIKTLQKDFFDYAIDEHKLIFMDRKQNITHIDSSFLKKFKKFILFRDEVLGIKQKYDEKQLISDICESVGNLDENHYIGFPSKLYRYQGILGTHPSYTYGFREIENNLSTCQLNPIYWKLSGIKFYICDNWDGRLGLIAGFECEYVNVFTDETKIIKPYNFENNTTASVKLQRNEYITKVICNSGWLIDNFKFSTSNGRMLTQMGNSDGGGERIIDLSSKFDDRNDESNKYAYSEFYSESNDEIDDKMIGLFGFDFSVINSLDNIVCNTVSPVFCAIPKPKNGFIKTDHWKSTEYVTS